MQRISADRSAAAAVHQMGRRRIRTPRPHRRLPDALTWPGATKGDAIDLAGLHPPLQPPRRRHPPTLRPPRDERSGGLETLKLLLRLEYSTVGDPKRSPPRLPRRPRTPLRPPPHRPAEDHRTPPDQWRRHHTGTTSTPHPSGKCLTSPRGRSTTSPHPVRDIIRDRRPPSPPPRPAVQFRPDRRRDRHHRRRSRRRHRQ